MLKFVSYLSSALSLFYYLGWEEGCSLLADDIGGHGNQIWLVFVIQEFFYPEIAFKREIRETLPLQLGGEIRRALSFLLVPSKGHSRELKGHVCKVCNWVKVSVSLGA